MFDNKSRFTWFYPLKLKSDFFSVFLRFQSMVENQCQQKILQFQWWWRRVYQQGFHKSSVKMWNQTDDLLSSYSSTKRFGWTKTQCTNVDHSLQKIIDISLAKTSSSLSFPFPSTLWHQNLLIIFHIHYMWNEEGFILIVRPWLRRK